MASAEPYDRTFTSSGNSLESPLPNAPRNAAASNARQVALDLVGAVLRRKRPLDDAIEDHPVIGDLSVRDRAFARLLVATVLRRLGQIDALIGECLNTRWRRAPRSSTTCCGSASRNCCSCARRRTRRSRPASIWRIRAVSCRIRVSSTRCCGGSASKGRGASKPRMPPAWNTPEWLWQSWAETYGEDRARAIAAAHLKEAPLDVTLRASEDSDPWCEKLQAVKLPTGSLRRTGGGSVTALPGYAEGAWWIQDAAASLPVRLFGPLQGLDVVDLCAAPGGKTAQLASAGARVTAIDRSTRRLDRLVANLNRLGLPVTAVPPTR